MSILKVEHLKKVYTTRFGGQQVQALRDVNFSVEEGEFIAIMGESGSGKTTLLNILAALDKPTEGHVFLGNRELSAVSEKEISAFRRDHLGFVFQDFNLLDTFTLRDNILLPLVLTGTPYREMEQRLKPLADKLGITSLLSKFPYEVSGGQKQRAAVARALITEPQTAVGGRTHRRAGQQGHRRPIAAVQRHQRKRADDPDGHPLRQGGQPCRAGAVHQGRRGLPSALPGRRHRSGLLSAHHRHPKSSHDGRWVPCVRAFTGSWRRATSAKIGKSTTLTCSPPSCTAMMLYVISSLSVQSKSWLRQSFDNFAAGQAGHVTALSR